MTDQNQSKVPWVHIAMFLVCFALSVIFFSHKIENENCEKNAVTWLRVFFTVVALDQLGMTIFSWFLFVPQEENKRFIDLLKQSLIYFCIEIIIWLFLCAWLIYGWVVNSKFKTDCAEG